MHTPSQHTFSRSLALCATVLNGALWMLIALTAYAAFGSGPSFAALHALWLGPSLLSAVALLVVSGARQANS